MTERSPASLALWERYAQDPASLTEAQRLQLLCSYAGIRDENVGQTLLDTFTTTYRTLSAPWEKLMAVKGMTEPCATLLQLVFPVAAYTAADAQPQKRYDTLAKLGTFLVHRYTGVASETVLLLLLDSEYRVLDCVKISEGSVNAASITPRRLIEAALFGGAAYVVLAHNHPEGRTAPSQQDLDTTVMVSSAFAYIGIPLLEHIVVAGKDYAPLLMRVDADVQQTRPDFYAE